MRGKTHFERHRSYKARKTTNFTAKMANGLRSQGSLVAPALTGSPGWRQSISPRQEGYTIN